MMAELRDVDRAIWKEELEDFVPRTIFDFHTHVFLQDGFLGGVPDALKSYEPANFEALIENSGIVYPGRQFSGIVTGWPNPKADIAAQNRYLLEGTEKYGNLFHLLALVTPQMDSRQLYRLIDSRFVVGLKPYKCYARNADPEDARITDFLPEEQMHIANERHLIITLHLSMRKGISDRRNLEDIEMLSDRYPDISWNLAHCGRAFIPDNLERILPCLGQLRKRRIYFDIAAVTDHEVFHLLISTMGADRILFGSDAPVALLRGRCVQFGNDWAFITEETNVISASFPVSPTFVIYEQLRALRRASLRSKLSRPDIENIFHGNAELLLKEVQHGTQ